MMPLQHMASYLSLVGSGLDQEGTAAINYLFCSFTLPNPVRNLSPNPLSPLPLPSAVSVSERSDFLRQLLDPAYYLTLFPQQRFESAHSGDLRSSLSIRNLYHSIVARHSASSGLSSNTCHSQALGIPFPDTAHLEDYEFILLQWH